MHADNNLEADIVADVQELTSAFFGNGDPDQFAVHVLIDRDQPENNGMTNPDFVLKSQYGDGNMGMEAEQQMLLRIDKLHTPWPMSHS